MKTLRDFYQENDYKMELLLKEILLLDNNVQPFALSKDGRIEEYEIVAPSEEYRFLHEAAIIEFKGTLFASWYNCPAEAPQSGNGRYPLPQSKQVFLELSRKTSFCI